MKKVLIISYYWPPCGGIGVLRCLKLAKYLREFGWEPIIYTAEDAHYPSYDEGNFKDIPEGIKILRQPIFEPYKIYKKFTGQAKSANANHALVASDIRRGFRHRLSVFLRGNIFIPDARAFWIAPSVRFLTEYLTENPVDAIFSDGPPHSNTRIATLVKKNTGIPWLADFQDPWTQADIHKMLPLTGLADRRYNQMEQEAFRYADKFTIASPTWKRDLEEIGAKNVSVFYWGFDPDDFRDLPEKTAEEFSFTHTGLLGNDRLDREFFRAAGELFKENEAFRQHFRLRLVGQTDRSFKDCIRENGLETAAEYVEQVPREKALNYLNESAVLLLPLNRAHNVGGRIPGKIFEYLALKKPVYCFGPTGSDSDNLLGEAGAGFSVNFDDYAGHKKALSDLFAQFQTGNLPRPSAENIGKYSNRKLTGMIAGFLEEISM